MYGNGISTSFIPRFGDMGFGNEWDTVGTDTIFPRYGLPSTKAFNKPPQPGNGLSSKYKTELCRSWKATGTCTLNDRCMFAHGAHELRTRKCDPRYKTKPCRTFMREGKCPYNDRCDFLHDETRVPVKNNEFWLVEKKDPEAMRCVKLTSSGAFPQQPSQLQPLATPFKVKATSAWLRRGPLVRLLALVDKGRATVVPSFLPTPLESTSYYKQEPLMMDDDGALVEFLAGFGGTGWLARASLRQLMQRVTELPQSNRRKIIGFL